MGIKGLSKLIADICPEAIKELEMKSFFGRRIAVDASMSIYQFLIAIRSSNAMMTNESGETTSHLVGLFYRTCKLLEAGIKPVYVFDGKAPTLKGGELEKRRERQKEAKQKYDEAKEVAGAEEIAKFSRRLVRVTSQHNDDCKKLLKLMGIPIICAPSEAEAQCAQLCKEGLVYGIATEDMDGLTFGSPRVIRHLSAGHSDKVKEYTLEKVLEGLELTREQFVDLCILMGCDYCDSIKGIGGKKGLELIKQYGSIEEILEQKFGITEFIDPEIVYKDKIRPPEKIEKDDENGEPQLDQESEKVKKEKEEEEEEEEKEKDPDTNDEAEDEPRDEDEEKPALKSPKKEGGSNGHSTKRPKDDSDENSSANESSGKEDSDGSGKKKKKKRAGPTVVVPEDWLFRGARILFEEPNVLANVFTEKDLKIGDVDEDGMIEFLVKENGFSEDRVRSGIRRVRESKSKSAQSRIDSFFKVLPGKSPNKKPPSPAAKRGATSKGSASKRGRRPR